MKVSQLISKWYHRVILTPKLTKIYDRFKPAQTLGQRGELAAERFLLQAGYVIVARGYEDKSGEIDLIAIDGETVVFAEVKTRASDIAGDPTEAVDATKQQHMTKTSVGYLKWHRLTECRARFDVIAILWPDADNGGVPEIRHYENAFEPVGKFQMF